ncbi:hypothetical protein N9Y75_00565 [Candidatus Poseidoniales archaeon]|nr:hypothetical protein [Candidatus Poseidoniales archaeon]
MPVKINFSSVVLFTLFIGFMIQTFRDPVNPGLWIVLAIFVGFGLFAQILVVNGIMQVTPANQMSRTSRGVSHNRTVMDYRNYHYNSIIAKINSSGVTVTTVDEAIKAYSSLFNVGEKAAKPFFNNQSVMSTLGLSIQDTAEVSSQSVDYSFWDNVSEGVAKNEAKSDEICAGSNCSKSISAFDFRCYQCRERFCESCKGSGLTCPSCS